MNTPIYREHQNTAEELELIIAAEEELDETAGALIDLAHLDKNRAIALSLQILDERRADVFYQATGFDVLYRYSCKEVLEYLRNNAVNADPYLLKTMLSQVTCDSGTLTEQEKVKEAAAILKDALSKRSPQELESISEEVEWFKKTFGAT